MSRLRESVGASIKKGIRWFAYCGSPLAVWTVIEYFQLITSPVSQMINLCVGAAIFVLGIPTSLFFRLDTAQSSYGISNNGKLFALGLGMMLINFVLISAVRGTLRAFFGGTKEAPRSINRRGDIPPNTANGDKPFTL